MKCEILRTPGLDLAHDLAQRAAPQGGPIDVPKDLEEGQTVDLDDKVAEALIGLGIAAKVEADKPAASPAAKPPAKPGPHSHPSGK